MIKEINNFLSDKECDYLIKVHNENYDKFGKNHNETEVLSLLNPLSNDATEINKLRYLYAKITAHIQGIDKYTFINFFEVVKWKRKIKYDWTL
jgi:hypothetical protein